MKPSPTGYLRRSILATQYFPIVNDVIDEEELSVPRGGDFMAKSTVTAGLYNLSCTAFSTPNRIPTTPVALKDLLIRTGRSNTQRPSVSGIFRGRTSSFANSKSVKPNNPEPMKAAPPQEADASSELTFNSIPSPNGSETENAYKHQAIPDALSPYTSPLGRLPLEVVGGKKPGKRNCRAITTRIEPPLQKRFKPPLLNNTAKDLLGNGLGVAGVTAKKSRTSMVKGWRQLDMGGSGAGIMRQSSFAAVREAW